MPGKTKTNLLPDFIHLEIWCPNEKPVSHTALTSAFLSTWKDVPRSPNVWCTEEPQKSYELPEAVIATQDSLENSLARGSFFSDDAIHETLTPC